LRQTPNFAVQHSSTGMPATGLFGSSCAAVGLGSVFMHLGAEVNWHELFHDLIDDFSIEALAMRQLKAVEINDLPAGLIASPL